MSPTFVDVPQVSGRPEIPGVAEKVREKPACCAHCGTPARPGEQFCCAGCAYVYRTIHDEGFDAYYRIKQTVTAPADTVVFQPRDFGWLSELQSQAETPVNAGELAELVLAIQGISCAGCVWLIEHVFRKRPGARDLAINAQSGRMRLRWVPGEFDAAELGRKLQAFNYLIGPADGGDEAPVESKALAKRIGLCAAFAMNIMLFTLPVYFGMEEGFAYARLFSTIGMVFGVLTFLVGGTYFLQRAINALRVGAMHIDLPIAVGLIGSFAGSMYGWLTDQERFIYFDFVGSFVVLMLVGRWAQVVAVERNKRRLLAQQPCAPQVKVRQANGMIESVAPEKLIAGQEMLLASGQTLPVESQLESELAEFSLASVNGEAEPRTYRRGQRVPAGAISLNRGDVSLISRQGWARSLLAELMQTTEREEFRNRTLERVVRGYLLAILPVATTAGVGWWITTADPARTWSVITAVLVVSCPCAVGLSFPLADEIATIALRRRGVFVRTGDLFAKLARVRQIVFDKTGTLTLEAPVLVRREDLDALSPEARSALHGLVRDNPHPVAQALLEELLARYSDAPCGGELKETIGQGVEIGAWSLGRPGWRVPRGAAENSDTVLGFAGRMVARFTFLDTVRPDAAKVLSDLRRRGLVPYILSGDVTAKVSALAAELGLPSTHALAELSPRDKATWLSAHRGDASMMLGDGANDSLAFDQALARGTPVIHRGVLAQKADFYYLGRGLAGIRALFAVNEVRRRTQSSLLAFSVVYNLAAVGLACAGYMNPLLAAIIMPASSLVSLALVGCGMRRAWSPEL